MAMTLTGCSVTGDDEGTVISKSVIPQLVLQPKDVGKVFSRFDEGPLAIADSPVGERSRPERFGRTGGWKARYRRQGSEQTSGPLVIESRLDIFEDAGGAQEEHGLHREELELQLRGGAELVEFDDLGDGGAALEGQGGRGSVVTHSVAWRHGNVSASVTANGFGGRLVLEDVIELARAQQKRIAAAFAEAD